MNVTLQSIIDSLLADRSSLEHPLIPDGVMDCSSLINRLLTLTHDGRALHSDIEFGIAEFAARLLRAVTTGENGQEDLVGATLSLVIVVIVLGNVVSDRYKDTSLEELLIDALHQDVLRALANEFSAIPTKIGEGGRPTPLFSLFELFATPRKITSQMRDGYVQRRKLPHITSEVNGDSKLQSEDFEVFEPEHSSGKCNLSDFDNLIADCCEGFDDYEAFYFDNEDRYHDE